MMERFAALNDALKLDPQLPEGYWSADNPKCPHCGNVCEVIECEWWGLYEEGEHDVCCPRCEDCFTVTTRVSFSFSTDKQDQD